MAITRAQQYKQMLRDGGVTEDIGFSIAKPSTTGKRPGYRRSNYDGSGGGLSGSSKEAGSAGPGRAGGDRQASENRVSAATNIKSIQDVYGVKSKGLSSSQKQNRERAAAQRAGFKESFGSSKGGDGFFGGLKNIFDKTITGKIINTLSPTAKRIAEFSNAFQREQYLEDLEETNPKAYANVLQELANAGYANNIGKVDIRMGISPTFKDLGTKQVKDILGEGYIKDKDIGLEARMKEFTPEGGPERNNSGISQILPLTTSLNPTTTTSTTSTTPSTRNFGGLALRFPGSIFDFTGMAEGGRAGFQTGGSTGVSMQNTLAQNIAANNAQAAANQKARGAISALLSSKTSQTSPATTTSSGVPAAIAQATPTTQTLQQAAQQIASQVTPVPGTGGRMTGMPQMMNPLPPSQLPSFFKYINSTGANVDPTTYDPKTNSYVVPNINKSGGYETITGPFDEYGIPKSFKPSGPEGVVGNFGPGGMMGTILRGRFYPSEEAAIAGLGISKYNTMMADGGRAGYMDGGMIEDEYPTGGIMDLESIRDEYFVGGLVKSAKKAVKGVTRAVKKVAKSPIGKLALGYALTGGLSNMAAGRSFGANFFSPSSFISKGGIRNIFSKQGLSNIAFGAPKVIGPPNIARLGSSGLLGSGGKFSIGKGLTLGLGIPAALDYFGVGKEKKEEDDFDVDEYYRTQGIDIDAIRNSPYYYMAPSIAGGRFEQADGGRTGYQEGGDAEPVAKKTMPLLDMDGQEKDYRETGGFVDMGRMERADDVPARLSKNEFVFTADAVRNAGEGDVDKGAEVMYNMMKNLESGGEVSEESQGLDGAREMFKTSQRLEEVL